MISFGKFLYCCSPLLLIEQVHTVYPKKYAHGFVVLCFVVVMQSFIMNSHEVFIHIHQGCFAGTGAIVRLPQCQWSKPDGYGKISQCITTTKHSKAETVCIFLGIYCNEWLWGLWVSKCKSYIKSIDMNVIIWYKLVGSSLHQHHDVVNNLKLYSLFNSLFRLRTKNIKAPHCQPFVGETANSTQRPSNTESVAMSWHYCVSRLSNYKISC